MNIVLGKQATSSRKKSCLQERFEKLRSRLEKQRRKNDRFRSELDELVEVHRSHSQASDGEQIDALKALAGNLITFAGRKSLSDWHRDELVEWIRDLVGRIEAIEPEVAARYRERYQEAVARAMGMTVEEMEEEYRAIREAFDESLEEDFDAEVEPSFEDEPDDAPFQEDMFGFDDIDMEPPVDDEDPFDEEFFDEGPRFFVDEDELENRRTQLMDENWIKGLFRRAAQALHPDREPDEEKRHHKQQQMRELLEARKQGDIMTLLSIYSENVDDGDIVVAEREMDMVCEMLEEQLEDLEQEKLEYAYSNPYRHMVYDILYASTKKARNRNIQEWKQELREDIAQNRELLEYLRNLTQLKEVLRERRDQRSLLKEIMFSF